MAQTSIELATDVWNPVVGCTRVSAGCDHCYAVTMTNRLAGMGQEKYAGLTVLNRKGERHFNGTVRCHEEALSIPLGWRKPRRIFVNSMSDLFHRDVPDAFIDRVFEVMMRTPQHTYQVLTKRPDRMAEYLCEAHALVPRRSIGHSLIMGNLWLGTSVENQQAADERIPHLLRCPAAVRFLSCEPLLGPVDFRRRCHSTNCQGECGWASPFDLLADNTATNRELIHWVIAGGESGPGARPMHPDWVRSLRDQCQQAGVPFFFKQWGAWEPCRFARLPSSRSYFEFDAPDQPQAMHRVGKKAAGRLLDCREWNEMPGASETPVARLAAKGESQ